MFKRSSQFCCNANTLALVVKCTRQPTQVSSLCDACFSVKPLCKNLSAIYYNLPEFIANKQTNIKKQAVRPTIQKHT